MNEEVFIQQVKRLRPQMVGVATRYLEDADDAEDMVQESLLKLWSMHQMVPDPMDRIAFTILKHRCLDLLRRSQGFGKSEAVTIENLPVTDDAAEELQALTERENQLVMAVDKLPSQQRLLLRMRFREGKDYSAMALLTGSSEDAIRKSMSRAYHTLFKLISTAVATIAILLGFSALLYLYNNRQFNKQYEGSYMIADGQEISTPSDMKDEIRDLLSQANSIEEQALSNPFKAAEEQVLNATIDPAERKALQELLEN